MHDRRLGSVTAWGYSLGIHLLVLAALGAIHYARQQIKPEPAVEAIFSEVRLPEEFQSALSVATRMVAADNVAAQQTATSGTEARVAAQREKELPPPARINYEEWDDECWRFDPPGGALNGITQELLRCMRRQPVLVVWLFDESHSMQDDQREIALQFSKVYEMLEIAADEAIRQKTTGGAIETAITSFGEKFTAITPWPTSNVAEIRAAFDKIGVDESGTENFCLAINSALDKYGPLARKTQSRLVLVLVTDESGDDGEQVEATLEKCRKHDAPLHVLGHEAVFGYPHARTRWQDAQHGREQSLQIRRGPETPFPEMLQWDGLHARLDASPSGFGPYEQIRLVRETGGVFFVLRSDEEQVAGREAVERQRFDALDMREYLPSLESRRDYAQERDASPFRSLVWETIVRLDPAEHPKLDIRQWHYPIDRQGFEKASQEQFERAVGAIKTLGEVIDALEKIKWARDQEPSRRWRANYDLILAQCLAYRVRLFQFCLALDQHRKNFPAPKDPQHNEWNIEHTQQMLAPDARVAEVAGIDTGLLQDQERKARERLAFVQTEHRGTPWANLAFYELSLGFSFRWIDGLREPRPQPFDGGRKIRL